MTRTFTRFGAASERPVRMVRPASRSTRWIAFAGATGLVLAYALRGGAYDNVVFAEHGLVIWWVIAVGIACGLLPRARPARTTLALLGALVAYAGWIALSLTWSESSELTSTELSRVLGYVGIVVLAVLVLDRGSWQEAAAGLAFGALVVCVFSVGTRLLPSVFGSDDVAQALQTDRLSYPFGYWNAVAAWGAMSMAVGVTWSAHDRSRVRRSIALALVPVAGVMTYLSYSRAGIAGVVAGAFAVLALSRNRLTALVHLLVAGAATAAVILTARGATQVAHGTGTRGAGSVIAVLAAAALACVAAALLTCKLGVDRARMARHAARPAAVVATLAVLIAVAGLGAAFGSRAWHSFTRPPAAAAPAASDPSARLDNLSGSRYPLWKSAVKAFEAHPLDGTGAGTWQFWWNRHGTDAEFMRNAHSLWFENLAELGLPGLLLIAAVAAAALWLAITARRRARRRSTAGVAAALGALFIVFLVHASVDWMWQSTAVTVLALAAVGVAGARLAAPRPRVRVWLRVLMVVAAVVAGAVQIPGLISTTDLRHSQAAERAGNPSVALGWANDAVSAEPWSASAYQQRGLVYEAAGLFQPAAADLQRAVNHEPTNYIHWLLLARIRAEAGQISAASADLATARRLRPKASVFSLAPYFAAPGKPNGILP